MTCTKYIFQKILSDIIKLTILINHTNIIPVINMYESGKRIWFKFETQIDYTLD